MMITRHWLLLTQLLFIPALGHAESIHLGSYIGFGVGASQLPSPPGTDDTGANVVSSEVLAGYRMNDRIAAEATYRALGEQTFNGTKYTYSSLGGDALLYFPPYKFNPRNGARLEMYGRAGIAQVMREDSANNIEGPIQPSFGLGGELTVPGGFGARAEVKSLGMETKTLNLGVVVHLNPPRPAAAGSVVNTYSQPSQPPVPTVQMLDVDSLSTTIEPATISPTTIVQQSAPMPITTQISNNGDSDGDGVPDSRDICQNSMPGRYVGPEGCTFNGIQRSVRFASGSSAFLPSARPLLDAMAQELTATPDLRIEIHAHSAGGVEQYDSTSLSLERAHMIKKYLVGLGVQAQQVSAIGHGSAQPVVRNHTADARQANERVEFRFAGYV